MKKSKTNKNPRIWEFDVDDSLILWNLSDFPNAKTITLNHVKGPVTLIPHTKNINLLVKLSKIGWFIRVHSGSGMEWAKAVVKVLKIDKFVDSIEAKPLGRTDDAEPGDGLAYKAFRDFGTGEED